MTKLDAAWALAGVVVALVPCLFMWGFTVDDALISVRYARHLASGAGYRFNAGGPVTDGVTPLPWPWLLAAVAKGPALDVLICAKCMGLAAWTAASAALGVAVGRAPAAPWFKAAALGSVALSLPVAAHAVSGMETAFAMACATGAVLCAQGHRRASAALAGVAAAFRPEMAPWALVMGVGAGWTNAVVAFVPFLVCALVRLAVFGRAAPLAVLAKPSDLAHGAVYAAAALLVAATPMVAMAPWGILRGARGLKVTALAALAHVAAIVAVGGDWMPYARLLAPIAPSLAWVGVLAFPQVHRGASAVRAGLALLVGAANFANAGPAGRGVGDDRRALIELARPRLEALGSVAAVDIGWVSAATEAPVIDLAGVTDPDVAVLPGGHTSKRIDAALLLSKNPEALLFHVRGPMPANWQDARYAYAVEARLAHSELIAAHYAPRAFLALGRTGTGYLLLVRK
ncbi:hypothetical protein LVJ94_11615 [Pendulispora rubella]|uniref:Glycosyltransferase RgtA/B/C/D-like domain-containing protein n=1 Tax=Pendulispora rubella TaxID=2741070 RepID=A0ABZ2LAS8_9BACT